MGPMKRLAEVGSARQSSLIAATTAGTGASASAGQGPTVRLRDTVEVMGNVPPFRQYTKEAGSEGDEEAASDIYLYWRRP